MRAAFAGIITGIVYTIVAFAGTFASLSLSDRVCGQSQGLDGLGCGLGVTSVAVIITAAITVGCGFALLKLWRVPRPLPIAVLSALNIVWSSSLLSASSSVIVSTLLLILMFAVSNVVYYWLFNNLRVNSGVRAIIIIGLLSGAYFGSAAFSSTSFLHHQVHAGNTIGFDLYKATYLPSGYRLYESTPNPQNSYTPKAFYTLSYIYGKNNPGDPIGFSIYESAVTTDFKPPACGGFDPTITNHNQTCNQIGVHDGNAIYYSYDPTTGDDGGFVVIGKTLVALEFGTKTSNKTEVLAILGSLKASDAAGLLPASN